MLGSAETAEWMLVNSIPTEPYPIGRIRPSPSIALGGAYKRTLIWVGSVVQVHTGGGLLPGHQETSSVEKGREWVCPGTPEMKGGK